jgi:hypothetical protein
LLIRFEFLNHLFKKGSHAMLPTLWRNKSGGLATRPLAAFRQQMDDLFNCFVGRSATSAKRASASPMSEAKPTVVSVFVKPSRNGQPISQETIRLCAYRKWEAAGKPGGDGVNFWLEAERQLSKLIAILRLGRRRAWWRVATGHTPSASTRGTVAEQEVE